MTNELSVAVDKIWQSPDRREAARTSSAALSPAAVLRLKEIFRSLRERANARNLLETNNSRLPLSKESEPTDNTWDGQSALVLLTLAIYHSDSLTLLPPELRRSRIASWIEDTGYPTAIVMEAILLGPAGLQPMLAE